MAVSDVLPLKNGEYQTRDLITWKTENMGGDGKIHGRFYPEGEAYLRRTGGYARHAIANM